jgi:hypothetical protein
MDTSEREKAAVAGQDDEQPVTPVNDYKAKKKSYEERLNELPRELRAAIEAMPPENSIFFDANGRVQRLSFNDLVRLDKQASRKAHNLVLKDQGAGPFARAVFNVDEKRPKVGIVVIHEWLTTQGPEDFGLPGLKKSLEAYGFDVRDVVLKKWSRFAGPEPAVYTYEESKLDRLEGRLAVLNQGVKELEDELKDLEEARKYWTDATLEDLTKKYASRLNGKKVTETLRKQQLALIAERIADDQEALDRVKEQRAQAEAEKSGLNAEDAAEQRRMTDLKAKLDRSLADCDLLVIPRMTLRNLILGDRIPSRFYKLDDSQVNAVRDFIASGKPVLACFGPANEPADNPPEPGGDALEDLFGKLGIRFGKQTVLFNVEADAFAERGQDFQKGGSSVEVPPVSFRWEPGAGRPVAREETADLQPNPLRLSLLLTSRSLGKPLDLRLRHPRPIWFDPPAGTEQKVEAEFMMTDPQGWNEDQPFPTDKGTPHYTRPNPDDPSMGTVEQRREGRFPIGVAVEVPVPAEWRKGKEGPAPTVRVAAIGQGGWFVGKDLPPAQEKLFLDTANWLLGREDHLVHEGATWTFPRVRLSERDRDLWHWGTQLGLPLFFAYLGVVVLLVRRLR